MAPSRSCVWPRAGPGPTANQRCFQDKAGMKSEEQVGHRPDSKHKTRAVCGANTARKVHPRVSSRHRCGPNARPSAHDSASFPQQGRARVPHSADKAGLRSKYPATSDGKVKDAVTDAKDSDVPGSACVSGHHPPRQGAPRLRDESLRAQDQESAETRGDARPGSPKVPAKGKLKAGGAPRLRVFVH